MKTFLKEKLFFFVSRILNSNLLMENPQNQIVSKAFTIENLNNYKEETFTYTFEITGRQHHLSFVPEISLDYLVLNYGMEGKIENNYRIILNIKIYASDGKLIKQKTAEFQLTKYIPFERIDFEISMSDLESMTSFRNKPSLRVEFTSICYEEIPNESQPEENQQALLKNSKPLPISYPPYASSSFRQIPKPVPAMKSRNSIFKPANPIQSNSPIFTSLSRPNL